jgi:hypothetical protein
MITGTDTLSYDYITLLVKCGIHNLVDHITRYTTTVDTHSKAHDPLVVFWGTLWMKSTITMTGVVYQLCIHGSVQ